MFLSIFRAQRPRIWHRAIAVVLLCLLASASSAQEASRGVALVIGNGDYAHLSRLANPVHDAHAIKDLLDGLGFQTDVNDNRD